MSLESRPTAVKVITIFATTYLFLLSIRLLGHSFKLFGEGFAETMISMTSNPFAGLIIGIVATSLIQSSSTTTSIVVGLVAGGALSLNNAIPIIMGANIGTTITNTLVSMGHISNRIEFRRAFSASIVHDFFNICSVALIFPLELRYHMIARTAMSLGKGFAGAGGLKLFNPLKAITDPAIDGLSQLFAFTSHAGIFLLVISFVVMFSSLVHLVRTMRSLVLNKLELIINQYLFRNDLLGFLLGITMTAVVQSSSVTTSLIIPLVGAGLITIRQIFPYTLGANVGTTITAILAALATQNELAIIAAFSHLCFNVMGIVVFYPLRAVPIGLAEFVGRKVSESRGKLIAFIVIYVSLYFIPVVFIFF